jgi:hypothetical protein
MAVDKTGRARSQGGATALQRRQIGLFHRGTAPALSSLTQELKEPHIVGDPSISRKRHVRVCVDKPWDGNEALAIANLGPPRDAAGGAVP